MKVHFLVFLLLCGQPLQLFGGHVLSGNGRDGCHAASHAMEEMESALEPESEEKDDLQDYAAPIPVCSDPGGDFHAAMKAIRRVVHRVDFRFSRPPPYC